MLKQTSLRRAVACCLPLIGLALTAIGAEPLIVDGGRPRAEIVVAEDASRTTRLAAQELQLYLERISGARLEVANEPAGQLPVKIFVGRSSHTDRLGVEVRELKHGAYRIVSGDDWLALVGDDTEFEPIEPWPRNNNDWVGGRVHREWHRISGGQWGNPLSQLRKHYTGSTGSYGKPGHRETAEDGTVHVWGFDERGSFNAVCGFLRQLGVRWYLPGKLGEVVPRRDSIPLPKIDRTVRPDFPVRSVNIRFGVHGRETARWAMRLGIRNPYGLQTAHGMHTMTHNEHTLREHPDWFALYGGKRHNQPGQRLNQLCYMNDELLQETVRFVRAQMDHYQFDVVSVMPPDGYTAICQCPKCRGRDDPDRGYRGLLSDYVWSFVNRVAVEVGKTHPNRMISCCAYGAYTLPPEKIAKLAPNVQVIIVGGRRPTADRPDEREQIRRLRQGWLAKTDNPIMIFENYPFTDRGFYLPAYIPTVLGESINATKGVSRGEDVWLSVRQDFHETDIGFNHFLVYFTLRMYWGGPQQDVAAMFDEYCRLFYGPAAGEMRRFFTFCEANWRSMEQDEQKANEALELFAAARAEAGDGSVHARRLALIEDYLEGLRNKRRQLAQKRGPVPQLRLVGEAKGITVDGRLDEDAWQNCPVSSTGSFRELQTGRLPTFGTQVKTAWSGGSLYFAIRCQEAEGEQPNVATDRDDDQAIWYGDAVEILLETDAHSYYQIAVSPSGAVVDLDRGAPKSAWFGWDSQAEAATHVADGQWTVEVRIPVVEDDNDPLHQVVGRKPTQSLPWHINVCRQRIRDTGTEHSALAPTGRPTFHVPMKFAHFYAGRSHRFPADPSVSDYLIAGRAAEQLQRKREHEAAIRAFVALAEGDVSDLQKSDALSRAAASARAVGDFQRAEQLAGRIPLESVAETERMHNLAAQRNFDQLISRYGETDFTRWPFWQTGEARRVRGAALAAAGQGKRAEADFQAALPLTPDSRQRLSLLLATAKNREQNLQDEASALKLYQEIAAASRNNGSADYFRGVQGGARILTRQERHDEALRTLQLVDAEKLSGYWRGAMFRSRGDTLRSGGRQQEALAAYREVLQADGASGADRKAAEDAIAALEGK